MIIEEAIVKKAKVCMYLYFIMFVILVIIKFHGSFSDVQEIQRTIQWNRDLGILNMNLIPLRTITYQIENVDSEWAKINLLSNLFGFVPFGYLLPYIYPRFRNKVVLCSIIMLLAVVFEMIQYIFMLGIFDIDDIIMYCVGAAIGYMMWQIHKLVKENEITT